MQDSKINMKQALNEKDGLQIWWQLLRPHTLTASFVRVFIGTMLAYMTGSTNMILFLARLRASSWRIAVIGLICMVFGYLYTDEPFPIFIGAIMLANNIRDLDGDKINGRKTIAILLDRKTQFIF